MTSKIALPWPASMLLGGFGCHEILITIVKSTPPARGSLDQQHSWDMCIAVGSRLPSQHLSEPSQQSLLSIDDMLMGLSPAGTRLVLQKMIVSRNHV